jgi:EAL domain-containing protein (putative c-di-GMP-specific phosphodiesterase class I)
MTQNSSPREAIAYIHDGMHVFANESYINLFHYSDLDEVLATPFMDMVADEFRKDLKLSLRNCQNAEKAADEQSTITRMEVVAIDANKAAFPASLCLKPTFYEGEHCLQVLFIAKAIQTASSTRIVVKKNARQVDIENPLPEHWLSEASITAALENDKLVLMYHPVVSSFVMEPEFYDIHPRLYGPQKEVGTAEQITTLAGPSLGQQLDRWVFGHALRLLGRLRTQGTTQQFQLSITAATAADPTFNDWLVAQLAECAVQPDALVVNMREADVLANIAASKALIQSLQKHGSRFCISGYSNNEEIAAIATECKIDLVRFDNDVSEENSLHMLPLQDLKKFVDNLHKDHIKVIAADVQDKQTVDCLWLAEVDLLQGAWFQQEAQELHVGSFQMESAV